MSNCNWNRDYILLIINFMKKRTKILIFSYYSYFANMLLLVGDLMPPFVRVLINKIVFIKFGHGSFIDYGTYVRYPSKIIIGNNVSINRGCKIIASRIANSNCKIIFHNNIAVGPGVYFLGAGHNYHELSIPEICKDIIVHDNVWIGARSTIMHGVVIGEGAVVAAGSLVVKDVPSWSVVAGTPARKVKERIIDN